MTDSSSSLAFYQTLENLVALNPLLKRHACSLDHLILLAYLRDEPSTMTAVSKRIGRTTAAATGSIDRLSAMGLVSRYHDAQDRRQVYAQLTAKGLALLKDAEAVYVGVLQKLQETEDGN